MSDTKPKPKPHRRKTPDEGDVSDALRLTRAGVGRSHAYMIVAGQRTPSLKLALEIFRKTGLKFGPLTGATDKQIRTIADLARRGRTLRPRRSMDAPPLAT